MHLIYNFFSGFCKSPPKRKQKITLLILPMWTLSKDPFQVQQTLGPEKQKSESLASTH
jgi:hypothetical protein